jgi:hypothetical protein
VKYVTIKGKVEKSKNGTKLAKVIVEDKDGSNKAFSVGLRFLDKKINLGGTFVLSRTVKRAVGKVDSISD